MNFVETILLENVDKSGSLFVFPTDAAASRWADHLLRLRHGGTVAMDKFIAWDTFKQNSIRSKVQGKECIPSALRRMFTSALIRENALLCEKKQKPFFASLIRPQWAGQADSSADWLTDMLPQLGIWFRQAAGMPIEKIADENSRTAAEKFQGDDLDLYNLALRYREFLDKHKLFEPAWETPPFEDTGKNCFIFFSDSLSDFHEYRDLLASSPYVKIIQAELSREDEQNREVFFYSNSRSEITEAVLYIMALHEDRKIPWNLISVSIPDAEYYGPYLYREFGNRNIPYVRQSGMPLSSYPAGKFFAALSGCISADFSFASLTGLVLNSHLPWKHEKEIRELIRFGIDNNCISSWVEEQNGKKTLVNVWEDAFIHPCDGIEPETRKFFRDLRRHVYAICRAASFSEIRKYYFVFRELFFEMDKVLSETDTILSRCISELMYLAAIEKEYPDLHVPDPFSFFAACLDETSYLAQQKSGGVVIFPYRTAAPAPFDCHIILGASQKALTAVFSPLVFLSRSRREKLGLSDRDASKTFITLHQFNSRLPAVFFCSEQTFSGYAIPHCALEADLKPKQRFDAEPQHNGKFADDLYRAETAFYTSLHFTSREKEQTKRAVSGKIHQNQKLGFGGWMSRRNNVPDAESSISENHPLLPEIHRRFGGRDGLENRIGVSSTSLAAYYECPLRWVFRRVLELENEEIETGLMADNITGLIYHSVLNLFLDEVLKTGGLIEAPGTDYALSESYTFILRKSLNDVFYAFPRLPENKSQVMSMLTARLLSPQKELYYKRLENFIGCFVSCFSGFRVIATEKTYQSVKDSCCFNGRVDCVLEDGRDSSMKIKPLVIVDFKTKTMPNLSDYTCEDGITDFQLPMYLRIVEAELKREVHTALFFSIHELKPMVLFGSINDIISGDSVPKKSENIILRGSGSFIDIMNDFDEKAGRFAAAISTGTFSVRPEYRDLCPDCEYSSVRRTLFSIYRG